MHRIFLLKNMKIFPCAKTDKKYCYSIFTKVSVAPPNTRGMFHIFRIYLCENIPHIFTVLQIHDMLVWIRIRGSMPLTNGSWSRFGSWSGSGCYFRHWPSRRQQKTYLKKSFSASYFLQVHLHNFLKIKSQKEVTNSRNQGFSYFFCLMMEGCGSIPLTNGSVSESRRPKNIWIRRIWIRIRNTDFW